MLLTLAYWIGLIKLLYFLFKIIRYYYLNSKKQDFKQRYGDGWAIITGTTNGIGKQICLSLARKGYNMVLISRDLNKLHDLEKELKQINPTSQIKIIVADFVNSLIDKQMFDRIEKGIEGMDVSIFINNAGVMEQGEFAEIDENSLKNQLIVNQIPMIHLLKRIVPMIRKHIERTGFRGAIVNVSSIAGVHPLPYQAVYNGTKAFNDFFSQSVGLEYQNEKIDYLTARPCMVTTNMTVLVQEFVSPLTITAKQCVEGIWKDLGVVKYGYTSLYHKIQGWLGSSFPNLFEVIQARGAKRVNEQRKQKLAKSL